MKAFVLGSTAAIASLAGFNVAQAQDQGQGTASVSVTNPAVLISDSSDGLQFSSVTSGGSVVSETIPADATAGSSATFVLSGQTGQTFTISLPGGATLSNLSNSSAPSLSVSPLTASTTAGVLSAASENVYVGGTLSVPPNTPAGFYSGTFTIVVNNP